jgi:hypothetical protein
MIVKVQRSVYSSAGRPTLLIYNEDNSMRGQWWLDEEWAARFDKGPGWSSFGFFAEVKWPDVDILPRFIRRVPEQPW